MQAVSAIGPSTASTMSASVIAAAGRASLRPPPTPREERSSPADVSRLTSFCTVGAVRDLVLFRDPHLMLGLASLFAAALVTNLALGQFNAANFTTSLALLPAAAAANVAGVWLVRKTPTGLFYQIAYVMLFIISVVLLWQGARDLLPL